MYIDFSKAITECLVKNGARFSSGTRTLVNKLPPWWDQTCENAVANRVKTIKLLLLDRSPVNQENYRQAEAEVKKITKTKKRAYRRKLLEEINPSKPIDQMWNSLKGLNKYVNTPRSISSNYSSDPLISDFINELSAPPPQKIMQEIPIKNIQHLDREISKEEYYLVLKTLKKNPPLEKIIFPMRSF